MSETPLIRAESLVKRYGKATRGGPVLHAIDMTINEGEFVALMGPSGSGKSTLMNILGCLDTPTSGHYFLAGQDAGNMTRGQLAYLRNQVIGFVFQGYNLLPRLNALDNIALPLLYMGIRKSERRRRALDLLHQVGLASFAGALPHQLSGGQQQRVAIARALANQPPLILADEPTGNLDTKASHEIMALFRGLNESAGITIVLVTHEADIAGYARRLVRIRDGHIESDQPVEACLMGQVS